MISNLDTATEERPDANICLNLDTHGSADVPLGGALQVHYLENARLPESAPANTTKH